MTSLAEKRDLTNASPELVAWLNTPLALQNATNKEVNLILAALKELPIKPATVASQLGMPGVALEKTELQQLEATTRAGRYFIIDPFDDAEKFVKVDKPEPPSRWSGYTFISSQASDYFYKVKDVKHKIAILKAIAVDPINAMNEYGIRLGVCGNCGRTLTAVDSRLRGIGPICAEKLFDEGLIGQATDEQVDILRQLGLKSD
jgi:hypothetical protein